MHRERFRIGRAWRTQIDASTVYRSGSLDTIARTNILNFAGHGGISNIDKVEILSERIQSPRLATLGRFVPGTILAERYRIVARLGRGTNG
jgi:hypothetical protein